MTVWFVTSVLLTSIFYMEPSFARSGMARIDRIAVLTDCLAVLGHRLPLNANEFTDREVLGESSGDLRALLGDADFERRLGVTLARMSEIPLRGDDHSDPARKEVRKLWSERQVVALRLMNREMSEDWAEHLRKGFAAREKELRRQLGDESYLALSRETLNRDVSK